jgi:hypothetical protein
VPLKSIAKDAVEIDEAAAALVDLADDVDDKDERKTLRAQAGLLVSHLVVSSTRCRSNACSWEENVRFVVTAAGQQIWTSGLVFPGKNASVVVYKGSYLVQVVDTAGSKLLARGTLEANKEGWTFRSGCVNQD